jgi:macrolide-specific efflux system membrane fusion protein
VAVNVQPNTIAPVGWAITMQTTALQASASFAETSVVGLKVGQPATVTVTAPNVTVPGTVVSITPVGTSSGSNSVVTFNVTVSLNSPPATVLSGMSASVAVTTAEAQNVITVPAIAVVGSSGNYEVRVLDSAGKEQLVPVQVGLMSSSLAEIQSGISAGQTVITGSVSALNSTSTSGGIGGLGGGGAIFRAGNAGGGTRTTTGGGAAAGGTQP